MNDKKTDMLLWVDVETTSLEPADGDLLEIGLRITDMCGLELARTSELINPAKPLRCGAENVKAFELHAANGLLEAIHTDQAHDLKTATSRLVLWIADNTMDHWALHPAGTNPQFDLKWLKNKTPQLYQTVNANYRHLDLTSLRLAMKAIGHDPYQHHQSTHRVDDCLDRDISEYTQYLRALAGTGVALRHLERCRECGGWHYRHDRVCEKVCPVCVRRGRCL